MWFALFVWSSSVLYGIVLLSTLLVVILDNRQPVKTVAWILVLVSLPLLGLILFYFFGQNVRKERIIGRKSMDLLIRKSLSENFAFPPERLPKDFERLIYFFERQSLSLPFGNNQIQFYTDGKSFLESLLQEIAVARHHIHLETYIFEDDTVGRHVRDALLAKASEGVEVRLIYDDVGCWAVKQRFFDEMEQKGIQVQSFLPVRFPRFTHKLNYRNHRKVCVIDGKVGFIGGMNLADRYLGNTVDPSASVWRDMHLRIQGGAVYGLQRAFLTDWYFATSILITDARYYPLMEEPVSGREALIQIVTSDPVAKWPEIMYGFTWIIQNARRYLYIQSPYFMPTEPVLMALQTAAMSGVDVRLMVPKRPDSRWLRWANESYFAEVLAAGVKVYCFLPGFLHSKSMIMDDVLVTVGSTNMDFRSFENNFEINAFIYDQSATVRMKELFEKDLANCEELFLEQWKKRSCWRRLCESFVRIFSPLL